MYDVIIIGGGLSGLLLAKEMSKNNKVLIVEKNSVKSVHKCITGFKRCFEDPFIKKYIETEFSNGYIKTLYSERLYINADYASLDEERLTIDLIESIKNNGGHISENNKFNNIICNNADYIEISTEKGNYKSKLLVDCSGHDSVIAKMYNIYKRTFYYNIFGGIYNFGLNDAVVYEIIEDKNPIRFLEVLPIGENKTVIYAFDFNKKDINDEKFKSLEHKYINKSNLPIDFDDKKQEVYGTIQTGILKTNAMDRIFLYGEAGLIAPIMTGFGFNNINKTYKEVSNHLERCLESNKLKSKDLKYRYGNKFDINQSLQLAAAIVISNASVKDFSKFQEILILNIDSLIKFLTCELNKKEILFLIKEMFKRVGIIPVLRSLEIKDLPLGLIAMFKIITLKENK